jgi:hypothetical protein
MSITVRQCPCGHSHCRKYWLEGFGDFVQGSGFTEQQAHWLAFLLNHNGERRFSKMPMGSNWFVLDGSREHFEDMLICSVSETNEADRVVRQLNEAKPAEVEQMIKDLAQ